MIYLMLISFLCSFSFSGTKALIHESKDVEIKVGDEISSYEKKMTFKLNPNTVVQLEKKSKIKILPDSTIQLKEGVISVSTSAKGVMTKVVTDDVEVLAEDATYRVSYFGSDTELHVRSGEAEMKSPYVQTFVPEIIKKREARQYLKKEQSFKSVKFRRFKVSMKNNR